MIKPGKVHPVTRIEENGGTVGRGTGPKIREDVPLSTKVRIEKNDPSVKKEEKTMEEKITSIVFNAMEVWETRKKEEMGKDQGREEEEGTKKVQKKGPEGKGKKENKKGGKKIPGYQPVSVAQGPQHQPKAPPPRREEDPCHKGLQGPPLNPRRHRQRW
ncbi:hypothetical protein EAI_06646 [Harpegnathos saltator]|uniref:Uncharacterized protein n=1 Tax=Harpegnathos saltator TaxID=610380 RepID=E2C691_HARSA|nr:hypothetical protein EAI_06646 [Harpegnathos saltator]